MTIVRNLQRLGSLANFHIWVRKFCNDDDIVLVVDNEDRLIGQQTLKILNSAY